VDIIQNNFGYFGNIMNWNEAKNDTKFELTENNFNEYVLIFQHYPCHIGLRTQWLKYKEIG
jgi:hypothetical protein